MLLLAASAMLVLLIACANLAGLQLGRIDSLKRELAVRSALGASRARLFSTMLMEGILLSLIAGAVGIWLGLWSVQVVAALAPPSLAQNTRVTLDGALAGYIFLLSIVAGTFFGIVPAYRATRTGGVDLLRSRAPSDRRGGAMRGALVVGEVAVATTLLVSAAVLLLSLARVLQIDPGFETKGVIAADLRLPRSRYATLAHQNAFFDDLATRMSSVPGVSSTCATNALPLETQGTMTYVPDGTTVMIGARPLTVTVNCFETLGIALRRGRRFERFEAAPVGIVSESYARRAWPGEDPLGKRIRIGLPDGEALTVIGVVEDTRQLSLESLPYAEVYRAAAQDTFFVPSKIVLRTDGAESSVVAGLRQAVREIDAGQPVENIRWLEHIVSRSTAPRRFSLTLLSSFAVLSLVLAAVGVYGLLSQAVSQRRAEIGVRLALGAAPWTIVRLVTVRALYSVALGIVIGLAGAWAAAGLLQRLVFGVSPTEPAAYAGTALLLGAVATLAAYWPTRRATQIDPLTMLRAE